MLPRVAVLVRYRGSRGARVANAVVRTRAERMLRALGLSEAELSILLCDGTVMRALNRRHRGGDYATDVLAFEMLAPDAVTSRERLLGDIVISIPTAARQARKAGKDTLSEVTMLLAHGLLHLLGLDHRDVTEDRRMRARTDVLVAAAGPARGPGRHTGGGQVARTPRVRRRAGD